MMALQSALSLRITSPGPFVFVVSKGGYSATVSGRTTCSPCKAKWQSVARVLTSACTPVVGYSAVIRVCQRVDMCLHAFGRQ